DGERYLRVRIPDNVLTDAIDIFIDRRIVDQLHLALDLGSQLATHRNLFVERVEVDAALVDIPRSDIVYVRILGLLPLALVRVFILIFIFVFIFLVFAFSVLRRRRGGRARVIGLSLGEKREGNRDQKGQK